MNTPPFGFFGRGSIESYNNHTAIKALEGCARKSRDRAAGERPHALGAGFGRRAGQGTRSLPT